jgi:hypothetical protein
MAGGVALKHDNATRIGTDVDNCDNLAAGRRALGHGETIT